MYVCMYVYIHIYIYTHTNITGTRQALVLTPCALKASRGIHVRLVGAILAAPMAFFDTTSAGSILNRFLQVC
jgi:ABC-type multidrug transport system fused ATPase/permease subunit